jgi:pseudouridine-5'-phosphate glycosidase
MNEDGTPLLQKFKGKELTIYLLKAVQELSKKVDSLEAQISGSN